MGLGASNEKRRAERGLLERDSGAHLCGDGSYGIFGLRNVSFHKANPSPENSFHPFRRFIEKISYLYAAITREYGAVFIIGIGGKLSDGKRHDGRAPDYDDWSTETPDGYKGLNGDLLVWDAVLNHAIELSSMGIRVDKEALLRQLELTGTTNRKELYFHKRLLNGELPQSIGGGIGQSRLCMFYLRKAHIGEIQSSIWPDEMRREAREAGINLI